MSIGPIAQCADRWIVGLAGSEIVGVGVQNRQVNERRKRLRRTGFDSMTALGLALYLATGWATLLAQPHHP